jgi:hypothetical protein
MPKYIMEDDCLTPDRTLRIDYKGHNPFKFYSQIVMLLRDILEIRSMDVWQREFRWDYSGDPIKFFYRVVGRKTYDGWTKAYIEMTFQGSQPTDPNKDGDMIIFITPKLRTEMPQDTVWQRSQIYKGLRWFYFRTFYSNARRILLGKCIHATERINERLKSILGILPPKEMEA